jgi:hypothetical protein
MANEHLFGFDVDEEEARREIRQRDTELSALLKAAVREYGMSRTNGEGGESYRLELSSALRTVSSSEDWELEIIRYEPKGFFGDKVVLTITDKPFREKQLQDKLRKAFTDEKDGMVHVPTPETLKRVVKDALGITL